MLTIDLFSIRIVNRSLALPDPLQLAEVMKAPHLEVVMVVVVVAVMRQVVLQDPLQPVADVKFLSITSVTPFLYDHLTLSTELVDTSEI